MPNPINDRLLFELHKMHDAAREAYIESFYSLKDNEFCEWLLDVGLKVGNYIGRIERGS